MLAKVYSAAVMGVDGHILTVEADLSSGLPAFTIVGLPDTAVQESRERVRAAVLNSEYEFPMKRITVNLAPADIKKAGPSFDLPISLGILKANGIIKKDRLADFVVIGELALDGKIRKTNGVLSIAIAAKRQGFKGLILPKGNLDEAYLIKGIELVAVDNLGDAVDFANGDTDADDIKPKKLNFNCAEHGDDFEDVKGQAHAKRALEIAAAGGHNILMVGPPGAGKTMLAKRMVSVMPPFSIEEAIEVTQIYSVAGLLNGKSPLITKRPFRAPHHTISAIGLAGGGSNHFPKPGEISLSHKGILFLDELLEFDRRALEVLRQPLETGEVHISRKLTSVRFPAEFTLIASMNPCPCGYLGDRSKECICPAHRIIQYQNRLSGPLADRIDLYIEVPRLKRNEMISNLKGESSAAIRNRILKARQIQFKRYKGLKTGVRINAQIAAKEIKQFCGMTEQAKNFLVKAIDTLGLSARAYDKILKVARTIADLDGVCEKLDTVHIAEAAQYRAMDRIIKR